MYNTSGASEQPLYRPTSAVVYIVLVDDDDNYYNNNIIILPPRNRMHRNAADRTAVVDVILRYNTYMFPIIIIYYTSVPFVLFKYICRAGEL